MNYRYITAGLAMASVLAMQALPTDFYAPASVLADGQWVKVGVEETGVYEISYDELRRMGFSDPSKVALYGRGGDMMPSNFTAGKLPNSQILVKDDLSPVAVLHRNNRVYFYGRGVDNYTFTPNLTYASTGGVITHLGKNIYSNMGYYFLTDSAPGATMQTLDTSDYDPATTLFTDRGTGFVYHEVDLEHNHSNTGQLFFGERFNRGNQSTRKWQVFLPDAIPGNGVMHCEYYHERNDKDNPSVTYGLTSSPLKGSLNMTSSTVLTYIPCTNNLAQVKITNTSEEVFITANVNNQGVSNLDFWSLTYPKYFPTLNDNNRGRLAQDFIYLSGHSKGDVLRVPVNDAPGRVVLDVTDPQLPKVLDVIRTGNSVDGEAIVPVGSTTPHIVVFDTGKTQLQVSGYEKSAPVIGNQNLHSYKGHPVDMVIITLPWLREEAEALAALHREKDGALVVVATAEEVYNEFSAGVPDPMAYRSFIKMLYENSNGHMKNALLMGPLFGDVRGIYAEHNMNDGLIAYQARSCSTEKGSFNTNDYYGMMKDFLPNVESSIEKESVEVGVAILPVHFKDEAQTYIKKVRKYYDTIDDHLYSVGRRLHVGGVGDNHTHERQAIDIGEYLNNIVVTPLQLPSNEVLKNRSYLISNLAVNAYGEIKAREKMFETLNSGVDVMTYYGHGNPMFLNQGGQFFNYCNVLEMRNTTLPLITFAGCSLSRTDKGERGLGEAIVTSTEAGAIATVMSTRDTWSGQNQDFVQHLNKAMRGKSVNNKVVPYEKAATLGEIFALTKTQSQYSNELGYQLVGDPLIRVPMMLHYAMVDNMPEEIVPVAGQKVTLNGYVVDNEGRRVSNFNGKVIARLVEPVKKIKCADLVQPEDSVLMVPYYDIQTSMGIGRASDGKFEVSLDIPASMAKFAGENAVIYISGLDTSTNTGMGYSYPTLVADPSTSGVKPMVDTTAPVIESMEFDPFYNQLTVLASDETALDLSMGGMNNGLRLYVDGQFKRNGGESLIMLEGDNRHYRREISLDGLSYGTHSARVEVSDAAGNESTREITFTISPNVASYRLMMTEDALKDEVTFTFEGRRPSTARLNILNPQGVVIYSADINSDSFTWDGVDNSGARVAPGRYKAYVIETGEHQTKGHSNTVDVPVI